jgi:ribosomal protein L40E
MAEIMFTIMLFVAVTAITAVLFGGWVIFVIIRGIARVLGTALGLPQAPGAMQMRPIAMRTCTNMRCLATNPLDARFCRRCGQHLPEAQRVAVRRAAMW